MVNNLKLILATFSSPRSSIKWGIALKQDLIMKDDVLEESNWASMNVRKPKIWSNSVSAWKKNINSYIITININAHIYLICIMTK